MYDGNIYRSNSSHESENGVPVSTATADMYCCRLCIFVFTVFTCQLVGIFLGPVVVILVHLVNLVNLVISLPFSQ